MQEVSWWLSRFSKIREWYRFELFCLTFKIYWAWKAAGIFHFGTGLFNFETWPFIIHEICQESETEKGEEEVETKRYKNFFSSLSVPGWFLDCQGPFYNNIFWFHLTFVGPLSKQKNFLVRNDLFVQPWSRLPLMAQKKNFEAKSSL